MGRGVCTCNYGGEEGRQGQEEGCQEEDREEGKEEGCQEAHEEAAEGQEEADLEEGCRQPRLARKACQEQGGLAKSALMKNKSGRIVSKKQSARGQKNKWIAAVMKARKELKIKGFAVCKKGTAFYKAARKNYGK